MMARVYAETSFLFVSVINQVRTALMLGVV